ncbi:MULTISPECIES: hypothetical protein [Empedobacter]|uniref:Cytochrome d ubiquinol oxidase subunit II n=1 Tax=Empedobacter falsenii TaxID=343874 RepID=A0ABY8V536_9FLAO|nr:MULTISPECIES: hypothetical protein [Empedobacter]WIH96603.1 hypothetical protein OBA43_10045 [Empedobacter falsenii]HJD86981.1 hypothetical protein [Empedobacter falsenii]
MKNKIIHLLILAFSSLLSGIMISKMSFIGKVGITIIYNEYTILKSWWKTALLLFAIQAIIFVVLSVWKMKTTKRLKQLLLPFIFLSIGIIGLIYTYYDFTETSHRLLKKTFHFGFYIFWLTWFGNCIFFMSKQKKKLEEIPQETEVY